MVVYLCSRVAFDARELNNQVAAVLREAGNTVYVPHEQDFNNQVSSPEEVYQMDFAAMKEADLCVAVGRLGRDCAWELGWFSAKDVPILYVPGTDKTWSTSPMIIPCITAFPLCTVETVVFNAEMSQED